MSYTQMYMMPLGNMVTIKDQNNCRCGEDAAGISAIYVQDMLTGIPGDLLDLFVPLDAEGLMQLEMNIVRYRARAKEREKVIQLQRMHGLPLHPNQSLRDVAIRLKILEVKKRREEYRDSTDDPSSDIDLDNR